ncbi:hypothetical protein FACS1894123_04930 [Bacteroidia bacterium]|nr:hypothetical protein FACS1894123_04930 [Bacteroidia bacterium]
MTGMNLNYAINPKFNIGATIMNLSEMPLTMKTEPGMESLNNTLFGFNTNYATQSQALTNLLDKLPFIELTAPSQITFSAEYAQLKPGHYQSKYGGNYSYIDDFEQAKMPIDLRSPYSWFLSSTPSMFNESRFSNNIDYGKNRSLLAWYYIDGLFTRKSSLTPIHIKNDNEQLSNHYVREILETEIYPDKDQRFNESTSIQVLNLAYYPTERGPYNLDDEEIDADGKLLNPEKRWAGITRKIESGNTDFEAQNIETIEFWLLDPFIYKPNSSGGDLYINLGEVSEDILKDEKKFFENGLPIDKDTAKVEKTVWGLIPKQQSLVYAFDNTEGARKLQDVGLNGLSSEEELTYPTYADYLSNLQRKLTPEKMAEFQQDPAGDNFHYFRGSDYDAAQTPILARYKHYNGTEGNSADNSDSNEKYSTAAKLVPDVEDINQDNTLNETENYFQYKISLNPHKMNVGENFIVQKREVKPYLKNGKDETVTWYQFKVPIQSFTDKQGNINDFRTIRFMRMFMTGFSDSIVLRFGTFELVRGEWRTYTKELSAYHGNASLSISTVNIEENGSKEPVNYIMPPGVNRILDPSQPQLRQQNEQAMSMKIIGLETGDARAIYKNSGLDSRQYRRIQMFAHAEKLAEDPNDLQDNDLSIFLRLGSDYKNNYYEYEIPVKVTPAGRYVDTNSSRETVWPQSNMFDFPFELLTNLKLTRNQEKRKAGSDVTYYTPFSGIDPEKPMNRVTVLGNPSISNIKVIMIGVRNNSKSAKSTEVWVNELRLTDFNEDGGWAGNANLFVGLSDLGSVNLTGRKETTGFGSLDQGIMERNLDDRQQMNVSTQVDIGKFFPEKAKVNIPMYYSYTEDVVSPKYNPLDQDVLMKDALDAAGGKVERDSIKGYSQDKVTTRSINFNNVSVDVRSKKPMPYDPANLTMSYSFVENYKQDATTEYEHSTGNDFNLNYSYSPPIKPWKPFSNTPKKPDPKKQKTDSIPKSQPKPASNTPMSKFLKEFEIGFLPKTIHLNSEITRSYFEIQLRDLGSQAENMLPASFREDFFWNRSTDLQWSLTKNLNLTFNSGTNARIESPHVQVNKKFNPDQYSLWKDSVMQSIRDLGTPLEYKQTFSAIYTVPFQAIPALNFINAGLKFNSGYEWNRGAMIDDPDIQIGNVIQNHRDMGIDNVTFNMLNLYNKSKFLNEVNQKYSRKKPTAAPRRNNNSAQKQNEANKTKEQDAKKAAAEKRKKKFEGNIALNPDSATVVKHQLDNTNLRITARNEAGKLYKLKFKTIDNNSIRITNKDSMNLKLIISQLPPRDESSLYKLAQGTARVAMMVRSVGFSYSQGFEMMVPNFSRNIDDFLGQGSSPYGKAPGFDFAFGMVGTDFLDKVRKNNWLIKNDANITPAMYNNTHTFNFTALLEPVVGMRVNLTGTRTNTNRNEMYFMYDGAPNKLSGDFRMSTIALGSAFESMNANNGYYSKAFETFLSNRQKIARRLEGIYLRTSFPDAGFLAGNPEYVGNSYNPDIHGPIDANSTDVLIPAFIAAYTGKNPKSVGLSAFPSLKNLLPNWAITYDGLLQIPAINKNFKTFTLEHTYSSTYAVGMFNSFLGWVGADSDGIGFIENVTTGRPYPSSPYDITAVSISEAFNPLIGVNSTLLNNMSFKLQYNAKRNVNLNVSAYQIVEMHENNITFGTGYRFDNFNKVLKIKKTGGANFNNEMKFSADIAFNRTQTLIRKIEDNLTQATAGNSNTTLKLKADYNLSKMITMQAFFDRQLTMPLISANAYPVAKSSFGVSVKINLTR